MNNKSIKIAVWIVIIAGLWILSGVIFPSANSQKNSAKPAGEAEPSAVGKNTINAMLKVETIAAESKERILTYYGKTAANRVASIKAETQGPIHSLPKKEGERVKKGEVLVRLSMEDRREKLAQSQALLSQRKIEYKAAVNLAKKGFQTEVRLAEAKTRLQTAKAELKRIELDIAHVSIRSPFDGVLEVVNVEIGDYTGIGVFGAEGAIAQVIDLDPLTVSAQVPQKQISSLKMGNAASVKVMDGELVDGIISYVGNMANEQTRTFRVEVEIPNPDLRIPAGIAAELHLPTSKIQAHNVPASLLSLDDKGEVGVKIIDADNIVRLVNVEVIEEGAGGVWLTGLNGTVRVITEGHAFAAPGQVLSDDMLQEISVSPQAPADEDVVAPQDVTLESDASNANGSLPATLPEGAASAVEK